jgi:hypothetical protein
MQKKNLWTTGWRGAVLIVVALVMGVNLVAPAIGHVGTTIAHIWGHIKPLADDRYLREGEIKFFENGVWTVNTGLGGATVGEWSDTIQFDATAAGTTWAVLHLTTPRVLGRRTFALKSVKICYKVTTGDRIDVTSIYEHSRGVTTERFIDTTDRTSTTSAPYACYTVVPTTSISPVGNLILVLKWAKDADTDTLNVGGVTTSWRVVGNSSLRPEASPPTGDDEGSLP